MSEVVVVNADFGMLDAIVFYAWGLTSISAWVSFLSGFIGGAFECRFFVHVTKAALAVFIFSISTAYFCTWRLERAARLKVDQFISDYPGSSVSVGNCRVADARGLLVILKNLRPISGRNRSRVNQLLPVVVRGGWRKLELSVDRESIFAGKYFVFYPEFSATKSNPIGEIDLDPKCCAKYRGGRYCR
jgi:hypothetical protein